MTNPKFKAMFSHDIQFYGLLSYFYHLVNFHKNWRWYNLLRKGHHIQLLGTRVYIKTTNPNFKAM